METEYPRDKNGTALIPKSYARRIMGHSWKELLTALIEDLESDLQKELDNPFFSQTDYIIRKIEKYKYIRDHLGGDVDTNE